jgi:hypothetical protein
VAERFGNVPLPSPKHTQESEVCARGKIRLEAARPLARALPQQLVFVVAMSQPN